MDKIDSCQWSWRLAMLHPWQKWRWRRGADGSWKSRGAKISVRHGQPWSSPGKEEIPCGFLHVRRRASLLNSPKRGKNPTKTKKTLQMVPTWVIPTGSPVCWPAFPHTFLFCVWHKQKFKLSGRCQEWFIGWLLESRSCFKKSLHISTYFGGWFLFTLFFPTPLWSSLPSLFLPKTPTLPFNKSWDSSMTLGSRGLRQNPPIFTFLRPQEPAVLQLRAFPTWSWLKWKPESWKWAVRNAGLNFLQE